MSSSLCQEAEFQEDPNWIQSKQAGVQQQLRNWLVNAQTLAKHSKIGPVV